MPNYLFDLGINIVDFNINQQNQLTSSHKYLYLQKGRKKTLKFSFVMSYQHNQKRHRSQFHKGMTLQQYLRGMEVTEDTIPTADSTLGPQQEQQQNLYKTSDYFYKPSRNLNGTSIKQMDQENYEESLDQQKDSVNILSSNLQQINKKVLLNQAFQEEPKKNYRIRNGKSLSPFNQQILKNENKKTLSPYKTFMKKFYIPEQEQKNNEDINMRQSNKISMARTLYGKQFEFRKSSKSFKMDMIPSLNVNLQIEKGGFQRQQVNKKLDYHAVDQKIELEHQKFDIRIQTLKDRLQLKRKNKNKP